MNEIIKNVFAQQRRAVLRHRTFVRRVSLVVVGLLAANGSRALDLAQAVGPSSAAPVIHCSWAMAIAP